jgi:hypothetical protein
MGHVLILISCARRRRYVKSGKPGSGGPVWDSDYRAGACVRGREPPSSVAPPDTAALHACWFHVDVRTRALAVNDVLTCSDHSPVCCRFRLHIDRTAHLAPALPAAGPAVGGAAVTVVLKARSRGAVLMCRRVF